MKRFLFILMLVVSCGSAGSARSAEEIGALLRTVKDPRASMDQKGAAFSALMEMGPRAKGAVPALTALITHQDPLMRDYAITTLTKIGPGARPALPALKKAAAHDADPNLRSLAQYAVETISGKRQEAATESDQGSPSDENVSRTGMPEPDAEQSPPPQQAVPAVAAKKKGAAKAPTGKAQISAKGSRPPLFLHSGRYFSWATPAGWKTGSEGSNSLIVANKDGSQAVSMVLLLRNPGTRSPEEFLRWVFEKTPNIKKVRIVSVKDLPDMPGGMYSEPWKIREYEVEYTVGGVPSMAVWTSGTRIYAGGYSSMFDGVVVGYMAKKSQWPQARLFLPEVARSITISNPGQVAGNDQLLHPKNNPLDNSALIESWRRKGLSEDRISKARREGTSGYERVKDPTTGQIYEMPLESWDGTVGGYRNPVRPHEILKETQPYE